MRIVLSVISIIFVFFVSVEADVKIYRRIRDRVPLFSAEDAASEMLVFNLEKAKLRCPESSFLFYRKDSQSYAAVCVTDVEPLSHGVVRQEGTEFYMVLKDAAGLRDFVYMDVVANANGSFFSDAAASLEQCSLMCLSSTNVSCFAFSFDVFSKKCDLYPSGHLQHGGKAIVSRAASNSRAALILYFEKLGLNSRLFNAEWGVTLMQQSAELLQLQAVTADACSERCITTARCLSFSFRPDARSCRLLSASDRNTTLTVDKDVVFFQLLETPARISSRPLFSDNRLVAAPGWPYSLSQGSWVRHILTPWGRSLVVNFERAADLPEGSCSWAVRINDQDEFCRPGKDGESGQTNSSINALKISSTAARNNFGILLRTATNWSCVHSDGSPVLLEGPGQLASPFYPAKSNDITCKWVISPPTPSTQVQVLIKDIDIGSGRFKNMLEFKSAALHIECTPKKPCDTKLQFKGQVVVRYKADVMPIKGFHLEYNFPSQKKPLVETSPVSVATVKRLSREHLEQFSFTKLTYNLAATGERRRLRVRLESVALADEGGTVCDPGKLVFFDPLVGRQVSTCWFSGNDGVFESKGRELQIQVSVSEVDFPAKSLPNLFFSLNVSAVEDLQVEEVEVKYDANFSSTNFPDPYPANQRQKWTVWSDQNLTLPVLRFSTIQLAQFAFNSTTACDNDRLIVSHAGTALILCGHVEALPRPIIGSENITVEMVTDDRYEDKGFWASVEMLPVSSPKPNEVAVIGGGSGILFCTTTSCAWLLKGEEEEEFVLELPDQCFQVSVRLPGSEKEEKLDCTQAQVVLPIGSELRYSGVALTNVFSVIYSTREKQVRTSVLPPLTHSTQGVTSPMHTSTTQGVTSPARTSTTQGVTSPARTSTTQGVTSPMRTSTTQGVMSSTRTSTTQGVTSPTRTSTTKGVTSPTRTSTTQEVTSPTEFPSFTTTESEPSTTRNSSDVDGIIPTTAPNRTGAILGSIFAVIFVAFAAGVVYFLWMRRQQRPTPLDEDPGFDNPMSFDANNQGVVNDGSSFDNPLAQDTTRNHVDSKTDLKMQEY